MASQDWFEKDFYAILGVQQDASDAEIKKVYRKLAREWHPDAKPGDAAAEQKFKEIGEAYAVLSDPEERKQYDAVRAMARGGARFTAGGSGGGAGGFEDILGSFFGGAGGPGGVRFSTGAGGAGINLEDLLGGMAGARGGGFSGGRGYGYQRGPTPGQDVQARATITFRQSAEGAVVRLSSPESGSFEARIPAGVKDGQKIRLRGKGHPGFDGGPAGDMILSVTVIPDEVFGRDGNHLTVDVPVSILDAALGGTVDVPTLDGSTVKIRVAPGTSSGRVLRVKGRGIATKTETGDLLAKVVLTMPELSEQDRADLEAIRSRRRSAS